jgi:cytochrome P450
MTELLVALTLILQRFRITLAIDPEKVRPDPSVTLRPEPGVPVRLEKISPRN